MKFKYEIKVRVERPDRQDAQTITFRNTAETPNEVRENLLDVVKDAVKFAKEGAKNAK